MNSKFDELTKSMAPSVTRRAALKKIGVGLASLALAGLLASPTGTYGSSTGPLIELSRPNAVGTCDSGFLALPGTWTLNDALEPVVVVNPVNPNNIVAVWIQGLFQNFIAAVSFDGGGTWQQVPVPVTVCSGGPFRGSGDPWLSFAPNGDLHLIGLVGDTLDTRVTGASKSIDGGLRWSAPIVVPNSATLVPDHPSVTADPTDPRYVYAIWDGEDNGGHKGPSVFSRTTDSGATWEPARVLVQPKPQDYIQFSQVLVLPDGTLVNLFEVWSQQPNKPVTETSLRIMRSPDHGLTWSAPQLAVKMTPLLLPDGSTSVVDPETGQIVNDPTNPSFAVDRRSGNLYAVWEDGRFSNFQNNDIAFSMSADGGLTWSNPIRVNQTPLNIPVSSRQSFFPTLAVADDGTIGVSHYDFRFNNPGPGLPTDHWLVRCRPSRTKPATDPANWRNETRLTDRSFNMEDCGTFLNTFRPGEYYGLATAGNDFVSAFTQVDQDKVTAIFFRRVRQ
jgi:hypothetical protein